VFVFATCYNGLVKKLFSSLFIIILLALIGGVTFAYTIIFTVPRTVISESFATIVNARSFHQDMAVKVVLESPFILTAEGMVATDVESSPNTIGPSRVAVVVNGQSSGFSVGAEIRFINDMLYGQISEFPFLSFLSVSATTSPIGKWYSVSLAELEDYAFRQGVAPAEIAKAKDQLNKFGQTEFLSQVDLWFQNGIFIPSRRANVVRVDGEWKRQYIVTIDKEKLADLVDPKVVADSLKSVTFDPLIVTIGLFDHSLQKITGGIRFANEGSIGAMAGKGAVSFTVSYRDINGPIVVTAPSNATSILEYIEQVM